MVPEFLMKAILLIPGIFLTICTFAGTPITVTSDFPGGNIVVLATREDTVWLKPDLSFTRGDWFYWSFKVSGISGRKITFRFEQNNVFTRFGPAYSLNNDITWKWYGENRIINNSFSFDFSEKDTVAWFSMTFPYVQKNLEMFLSELQNCNELHAGTLCQSEENRAVELLRFSPDNIAPKFRVLITARHHACESMASYVLEGIVRSILNERDLAFLRENVECMIIPFIDKDGVENGEQGKNRIPRDHNRDYDSVSVHVTTAALRQLVPEWSEGRLVVALDLHCPWIIGPNNEEIYIAGNQDPEIEKQQVIFSKLLEKHSSGELRSWHRHFIPFGTSWNTASNYTQGMSFGRWAGSLPGVKFAGTIEFPYSNVSGVMVSPEGARNYGKTVAYTIQEFIREQ